MGKWHVIEKLKKLEKGHEMGQDDEHRAMDEMQKLHDRYIGEVNRMKASLPVLNEEGPQRAVPLGDGRI